VARAVQLLVALVGLSLVAFWAFGLWSRMADARAPGDSEVATEGSPQQLADSSAAAPYEPGEVYVIGDSLTSTAWNAHGVGKGAPEDLTITAWPGWSAAEAQPSLEVAVAQHKVDTLILALGTNDSTYAYAREGWNGADVEHFRQLLATPDPSACVVVVLPGYGPGIEPSHAVEMNEARADLTRLAEERRADPANGPTVVVDWQTQLTVRPDLVGPDGIHLVNDPAIGWPTAKASAARTGLYWHGVAGCAGGASPG
jgi:hypothetical protein